MSFIIRANETLLAARSVPLFIVNTDGTEHGASLAGVKARISVNGGTAVNSTADVSRVDGADCSLVLTTAEVAAFAVGDRVRIRVPAAGARAMAAALVEVSADNVFAAADTAATIATAVDAIQLDNFAALPTAAQIATAVAAPTAAAIATAVDNILADNFAAIATGTPPSAAAITTAILAALSGADGTAARVAAAEACALAMVGAADLRFDDAGGGTSLVVVRKSNSATIATIPLRRGDRTTSIIGNG
jgi:hypothetical protein